MVHRSRYQRLGGGGLQIIVAVGKLQVFAPGQLQPQVAGGRNAPVVPVQQDDAAVDLGVHFAHLQAHILAAIVQQNDLDVLVGLAADAFDAAGNVAGRIVHRHNDADQRLFGFRHGGSLLFLPRTGRHQF